MKLQKLAITPLTSFYELCLQDQEVLEMDLSTDVIQDGSSADIHSSSTHVVQPVSSAEHNDSNTELDQPGSRESHGPLVSMQ